MGRINVLDECTYGKIAAGEVIERPCSVVKELVENSIDAGSTNIIVKIEEGGQKSISVIDNGTGIYINDIEKAFLPHATSKIKVAEDLFKLNTMGFRGEALASISCVSKITMKTRNCDFDYGKEICIEGGVKKYTKDVGLNIGTTIEVRNLFYNVPARKKFLKSSQRETALITDIVTRLSLANSNIAFSLYNNKKKVKITFGNNNLYDTVSQVYGKDVSQNIIKFEGNVDIATVYGYIGNSEISRKSRNKQNIFINKRYVKNNLIVAAVENAFKSFITINKFPFFILFLDIYPEYVDINVHPTKSEIKFTCDRLIYKLVFDSVHKTLAHSFKEKFMQNNDLDHSSDIVDNFNDNVIKKGNNIEEDKQKPVVKKADDIFQKIPVDLKNISAYDNFNNNLISQKKSIVKDGNQFDDKNEYLFNDTIQNNKEAKFGELSVIGQFNNTYIIAEYNKELYIIDQHAAHEKILFEKYRDEILNNSVIIQVLAVPVVLELSEEDYLYYNENKSIFKKLGFSIELFGVNTICIREVPIFLGDTNVKGLFFDIIDNIKNIGECKLESIKYNKLATTACKAAVKANNKLSIVEMEELIKNLRFINEPFTCPHGRPTIIKITLNELEKRFKRIQ